MPKKCKLSEQDIHAMIVQDSACGFYYAHTALLAEQFGGEPGLAPNALGQSARRM